jgi:DNA processing protein
MSHAGAVGPDVRQAWVALATTEGVGEATLARLIEACGGPAEALNAVCAMPARDADRCLARRLGLRPQAGLASAIRLAAADPERVERRMRELGGWVLTPFDGAYPDQLRELDPPPPALFGLGDVLLPSTRRAVAIVGTRRPTVNGRAIAARVADALAAWGVVVVSGLAVGIDGVAHAATVEGGGRTVAVVGGGLARPGPRAHRTLVDAILRTGGAILSELPADTAPSKGTFPRRNRIISGLASATVVVEAPARSGALITARHALEQGRLLLAAPGRPFDPATAGCLALLRETPARPLTGLDEMLEDLDLDEASARWAEGAARPEASLGGLAAPERDVAQALRSGPASIDRLSRITGLPTAVVAAAVTLLQMRGWAQPVGPLLVPAGPLLRGPRRRP